MKHLSVERIYREIELLSVSDRDKLFALIKRAFYQDGEIIAYSTDWKALTHEQYRKHVKAGINQCKKGKSTSLEELSISLGYDYDDL